MGLEAGKFFVSLGLKGTEKTLSGLAQTNDHFAGLKGISTEAKLAILGVFAGLEQIVSVSGKAGNEFTKLHQHMLVSFHDLQLYEAMAQRMGAPEGAMTQTFDAIRQSMIGITLGKMPPDFLPQIMALMQQGGIKIGREDIYRFGHQMGGPVEFFNDIVRLIGNSKVNQSTLQYMLQEAGISSEMYDITKMGAFNRANRQVAGAEIVSDTTINKMNQLNKSWKDFELETTKIMHLFSEGILPVVDKMASAAKTIADHFADLRRDVDSTETTPADVKHFKEMDALFFKLHPDVAALVNRAHQPSGGVSMSWSGDVNIHGADLGDHAKLKKVVKGVVHDAMSEQRTKTLGKTSSTRTGP